MSTWLVTGGTGLLGSNAALHLGRSHHVIAAARSSPMNSSVEFVHVDLGNGESRARLVEATAAQTVLHAAAISSIDECEQHPQLAREINVAASADLAKQAEKCGSKFVYISTDAVFDGALGNYTEYSAPSPTTEYGRSKLAGELAVLDANPRALVARVNFYGWSPGGHRSLAEFFFHRLSRGENVLGFDDVVVSTLYVGHLIELLERLIDLDVSGVVNVVSSEATSKFEFGRRLARSFGLDQRLVRRARSTEHLAVQRGARLSLSTEKITTILGEAPPNQQDGVDRLVADRRNGLVEAVALFRTR